jgi:hypothetical protein
MLRRLVHPARDPDGLPTAHPLETRIARVVTAVAAAWFLGAAGWEFFGPILAGHYAASAGIGIAADNMLTCHLFGPALDYWPRCPLPAAYYSNHPWGIFWTTAALMQLFGRHDFVCRLAPVLLSAATPILLYQLGRAIWRPAAGAAAAAAFTVLPITLAFANFNALEVPVIAWSLLGLCGFARLTQTGRRRYLVVSLLGTLGAVHGDWPALVLTGAMLGFGLVRAYLLRGAFGPVRNERGYAEWWTLTATLAVASTLFYLWAFHGSGKLAELVTSFDNRSGNPAIPLPSVLESRRYWIELSFTPIAIALGKLAAIVGLLRLLVLRRELEVIPLAVLAMATVQYVLFKQGADIHVFWPHYFGAYFALAMGQLVATLAPALAWVTERLARALQRPSPAHSGIVALGCALLPLVAIARDGVPALRYARGTGGRFNEKGLLIDSDGDKTAFLRLVRQRAPARAVISMHAGMKNTWAQNWTLRRHVVRGNDPPPNRNQLREGVYLADTRFLPSGVQGDLAGQFHVTAVGPFWWVTGDEPAMPLDAFALAEREPPWWEWYFVSGTEPHREIVADPYLTWELRTHFGQPAEVPSLTPRTLEHKRIAHNIAVTQGDLARAAALDAEIGRELRPVHATFHDGTQIVGATYHAGARPLLTLYLRAGAPMASERRLAVTSRVLAGAWGSTTMPDPTQREVGLPLAIPSMRWIHGFLYSDPVPIRKRPGTEEFVVRFMAEGKGSEVVVLKLPEDG